MTVTSATSTAAAATTSTTTAKSTKVASENNLLNYNAFLKLFIAQLKNQDPTQPADSATYIAQLANFSNVEQSIKTNAKLDEIMTLSTLSQASNLIGRTVTSADGETSGVVESLRAVSGGTVAVLKGGKEVTLGEGVEVSG
jgi:flagellar basal-body rod modification protein FlgD